MVAPDLAGRLDCGSGMGINFPDLGGWQAWEYGTCDLQVAGPEGIGFATWELDPASPPRPDATSLASRSAAASSSMAARTPRNGAADNDGWCARATVPVAGGLAPGQRARMERSAPGEQG